MSENARYYYVVMQGIGTDKGGNYLGVRTLRTYKARDMFDRIMSSSQPFVDTIIYVGYDEERAKQLAAMTPGEARANALMEMIKGKPLAARTFFINEYAAAQVEGTTRAFLRRLDELGVDVEKSFGVTFG